MESQGRRLAVMCSFSGQGGVERMMMNLLEGFAARGCRVDLLALGEPRAALNHLPAGVTHVDLGVRHSTLAVPALARYLRRHRPAAMLVAKDRAIRSAALARRLAGVSTRLIGRLGTNLSASLEGQSRLKRQGRYLPMRWCYPMVDAVVAVSEGVAQDIRRITGLSVERTPVIHNPVVTAGLRASARQPLDHPWFRHGEPPVVLGVGRLTRQKDFPTLMRAFARLRRVRPCRLFILGEGRQRAQLQALTEALGVAADVQMPGAVANPYAYLQRAALFVLASIWEGSPNALTEALALGTPVVATDCPSGPREILADGRYGPLVPVGASEALARAMAAVLERPLAPQRLQEAASDYTVEASAAAYLRVLGIDL
ncbi:glycosyltransferase [Nitrococcus mobilis]|uniref:Glycosyl transferase, group 1 family protein n=1 Tax=Nitrococcus mobilis Nb-231 TaxID=314278 RepID=A4BL91_9GAMM|nr:glycosyltransferase [Nitrococcus mobilis]EAR23079.1 glycosyl transferase, group 1 family protein [Nitrococcus mobilis Nb-231]